MSTINKSIVSRELESHLLHRFVTIAVCWLILVG